MKSFNEILNEADINNTSIEGKKNGFLKFYITVGGDLEIFYKNNNFFEEFVLTDEELQSIKKIIKKLK